jgi:uncharacterized protein YdbL (DUF1318 family)
MKTIVCAVMATCFVLAGGVHCTRHKVDVDVKPIKIEATIRLDIYHHLAEIEKEVEGAPRKKEKDEKKTKAATTGWLWLPSLGTPVYADEGPPSAAEAKAAIEGRKGRAADVQRLRTAGTVGENRSGYLGHPPQAKPTDADRSLVAAENADRRVLYRRTAATKKVPLAAVEQISGEMHRNRARKGDWIEAPGAGGTWAWEKKK